MTKFVTLITGAGRVRGVGAATLRAIAATANLKDHCFVINYLNSAEQAQEVAAECESLGAETLLLQADLREADQRQKLVDETVKKFGRIDLLVNNAGKAAPVGAKADDVGVFQDLYLTNAVAPHLLSELVAAKMKEQGNGDIIFVSSVAAKGGGSSAAYGMSKSGVDYAIATLMKKYTGTIRVNGVAPGVIDTQWWDDRFPSEIKKREFLTSAAKGPVGLVSAEDVAAVITNLVFGEEYLTGKVLPVKQGDAALLKPVFRPAPNKM